MVAPAWERTGNGGRVEEDLCAESGAGRNSCEAGVGFCGKTRVGMDSIIVASWGAAVLRPYMNVLNGWGKWGNIL
jgi:hypothetical protein